MTPQLLNPLPIVCNHSLISAGDQFRAVVVRTSKRRRQLTWTLRGVRLNFFAGFLIDTNEKERSTVFFITLHNNRFS